MSSPETDPLPIPEGIYLRFGFFVSEETTVSARIISREPLALDILDLIGYFLRKPVTLHGVDGKKVDRYHKEVLFKGRSQADLIAAGMTGSGTVKRGERLEVQHNDAPVVKLVNSILEEAIAREASDVHIEPHEQEMVTRYRIHGQLVDSVRSPLDYFEAVSSRVKYLARLDITQKMLPQDGKAKVEVAGQALDLRVSTIPTKVGESVVIRILRKNVAYIDIDRLGLEKETVRSLGRLLKKPDGLILSTGPTGSGKSTTLYAMLKRLHRKEVKILTVEDPVEYEMEGINQVEVNSGQGVTFANILRHALRHDPDVIMVGEIRDEETARMTIQASLTGHLVLSSLHTQDSVTALTRLLDLGIEPYLISSSLKAVLAQRLLRRLCDHCKAPEGRRGRKSAGTGKVARGPMKAVGCAKCQQTGFSGRMAIVEYLEIDGAISALMAEERAESRIKDLLRKRGFPTLADLARRRYEAGETAWSEVSPYLEEAAP